MSNGGVGRKGDKFEGRAGRGNEAHGGGGGKDVPSARKVGHPLNVVFCECPDGKAKNSRKY